MGGAPALEEEVAVGLLVGDEAAGARADDAGRAIGVGDWKLEARLLHRLIGGGCREPGVAVGVQDELVALEVLEADLGIEILDLRRNEDLEIFERKALERGDAALAGLHRGPDVVDGETDRRDDARAGHYDAAGAVRFCHGLIPAGCGRRCGAPG